LDGQELPFIVPHFNTLFWRGMNKGIENKETRGKLCGKTRENG